MRSTDRPSNQPGRIRLSRLHPYPAMVAEDLALEIVDRYLPPSASVLDPFCGSGRLLAAAVERSELCVGIDTNPLACLLTRAKLEAVDIRVVSDMVAELEGPPPTSAGEPLAPPSQRKVDWFPEIALVELSQILEWINAKGLEQGELALVGAAFSATVRDVSYARKGSWKLHRLDAGRRQKHLVSAWETLRKRLRYCLDEICSSTPSKARFHIELGDARRLSDPSFSARVCGPFDVVLTSPPYGDSRTTVQYGAASSLCLQYVSRIRGLEDLFLAGHVIDANCLGGKVDASRPTGDWQRYWAASRDSPQAAVMAAFMRDYAGVCAGISAALRPGGLAVLIVGRRSVGGFRLKLDDFTADQFAGLGMTPVNVEKRRLVGKRLPRTVNRFGRSASAEQRAKGITPTIGYETVVVFRK